MPYNAFDKLPKTDIAVNGATLHIGFAPGELSLPQATVLAWIAHSAKAVTTYYGKFPVSSARILIVPVDGKGMRGGTTWAYRGAAIRIVLGRDSTEDDLKRDWMLVHEMVHLALPDVGEQHSWLSEGLATYVEPIARAQAGDLNAATIWGAMLRDMHKGLPQAGDQGLDNTHTWGRTYWGGAMFCLLADIEIRKQSGNRLGLQDAMRGVLAAGGNHESDWSIQRVLATADKAVGLNVLSELYAKMSTQPITPDLDGLWRDLGIKLVGDQVSFDDSQPLAQARKALTELHP
ncbi:hypothetical protein ELE36_10895 [Pseudolysobacter antarcticus]|uniref:Peptidase M61 catalytic domain-containing protein n=2 Tax=Pseudolysobacter antarcticus TaxID=2511995 RepID=A0A411HQ85_9GAMM|nr:hypothetical protein ELE36_10895 [Pseudolysobacter antarcticus]